MKIKSFGCSFIWGSEISDEVYLRRPSLMTWPAMLSKKLDISYECYARPGVGNLYIANEVMSQALNTVDHSVFVINWTFVDRFDYISGSGWECILPGNKDNASKFYFSNLHSEFRDKLTNLITIVNTVKFLLSKNIPFIMTNLDPIILDQKWNVTPAVIAMQIEMEKYLTTFDNTDFLTWAKNNGHTLTENGHLLEVGHLHVCRELEKMIVLKKISSLGREMSENLEQKIKEANYGETNLI